MDPEVANHKVYIHEYINIIGHNRASYMHHMTANWSPIAQEERNQLCYGVWGIVGSTGQWPAVVNLWEEDGWDGLAASFGHELGHAELQDPKLAHWWATAAEMRSGGFDRLLLPAPWSPTIDTLCAQGAGGSVYAHDQVTVAPGRAGDFLELCRAAGTAFYDPFGWRLIGAWVSALRNDDEAFVLWSIPTWADWAQAERKSREVVSWRAQVEEKATDFHRILLADAPLCPLRIGRQPTRDDRDTTWNEE